MPAPPDPQLTSFSVWELAFAAGTLVLSFVVSVVSGTWIIGNKINEATQALDRKITGEIDVTTQRFGETVAAARQKMTDMELWNRDTFVSKGTFNLVISQIRESWQRFEDNIGKRLDRIEDKIDHSHNPGSGE